MRRGNKKPGCPMGNPVLVYVNKLLLVFSVGINTPLLTSKTAVVVVAPLCVVFSGSEEFGCFFGVLFHYRCVTNFAFEEVFKFIPVRLFAVESEGVFAFSFESWVVAPEVPVTACNSERASSC